MIISTCQGLIVGIFKLVCYAQLERVLIVFFDKFKELCAARGVTPTKAAIEAGINKSAVTYWRNNPESKPTGQTAEKLCAYFGVSMSELYGEVKQEKPLVNDDEELTEYLEMLRTRPEMKMMFQLAKDATKADVEKAVKIIEMMLGKG